MSHEPTASREASRARAALLLVALIVPLYGARLGAAPLFDRDEAFYVQAAREMAARDDRMTPWFNDAARFDKPILFYWAQLASRDLLGESETAARLPSAIAVSALVALVFCTLDGLAGTRAAFAAALLAGIAGESLVLGRLGIPDATFALFLTGMWLCAFAWVDGIVEPRSGATWLAVFGSLAILTKGIVAPVLLVLALAGHRAWSGPFRGRIDRVSLARLLAVGALLTAPWFAIETALEGWEFPKTFFFKHHFERFVSGLPGHDKPWWYFATNVPFLFLPAIVYLPAAVTAARRADARPDAAVRVRLTRFAFAWFAAVLVFFSLSRGKLANYVFPALPAAAIVAGLEVEARWARRRATGATERVLIAALAAAALACVSLSGAVGRFLGSFLAEENRAQLVDLGWWPLLPGAALAALAAVGARALRAGEPRRFFAATGLAFAGFALFVALVAMPAFGEQVHGATRDVALRIGHALDHTPGRILQYKLHRPTMVFYARHPITVTKDREDLDAALASPEPLFVATLRKHLAKDPIPGVTEIGGGDRVVVLANDAALAALRQRER